jgi:hypothetical protein
LLLTLDAANNVQERNESNNSLKLELPNTSGADNALRWEPLEAGGGFMFSYRVENPSGVSLPDTSIKFFWHEGGEVVHTFAVNNGVDDAGRPLKAHGVHTVHVRHGELNGTQSAPPRENATLAMQIDPQNTVLEVGENDNFASLEAVPLIVNIITHGWNSSGGHWDQYADVLDKQIPMPGSILEGRVETYVSDWESNDGFTTAFVTLAAAKTQELIGNLTAANLLNRMAALISKRSAGHATAAAKKIVADVKRDLLLSPDESQRLQKIQIFGHSRGAAVNAMVSNMLAAEYPNIVTYVALDGFSTDWPDDAGLIGDISIVDQAVAPQGTKRNYRVEQGLQNLDDIFVQILKDVFGFAQAGLPDIPLLTSLFTAAFGDLRAPNRPGFINSWVFGIDLPSNHLNIHRTYFPRPIHQFLVPFIHIST